MGDKQDQLRGAFQACFNSASGQTVLEYLMEQNWIGVGIPPGDAIQRAENEGQRQVVLDILAMLAPRGEHTGIQAEIMHPDTARMIGLAGGPQTETE